MPVRPTYRIDRRLLERDFNLSEAVFKREADQIIRERYFNPAVAEMQNDFDKHDVTREIDAGIDSDNISDTLKGDFANTKGRGDDDGPYNLYSFIGFDPGNGDPLEPIRKRLDPTHQSGPKLVYQSKDKSRLVFTYEIKAPNEQVIANETPMPWAKGSISWSKRIEQGIPGIAHYLNVRGRKGSRSGGGIQVGSQLPGRTSFRPVSYLSGIFRDFLRRAAGYR